MKTPQEIETLTAEIVGFIIEESRKTLTQHASDKLSSGWNYLRWYPESLSEMENGNFGKVVSGLEASPCYPESEYFHQGNHPVTFWSDRTNAGWSHANCGLEWVPCDEADARYICNDEATNYAVADDTEQVIKLASQEGLGEFDSIDEAADALIKSGGYWFELGDPVDGIDTSDLEEELTEMVSSRIESLLSEESE